MELLAMPKDLVQEILNFLATQKYGDVVVLINKIMAAANSPKPPEKPLEEAK